MLGMGWGVYVYRVLLFIPIQYGVSWSHILRQLSVVLTRAEDGWTMKLNYLHNLFSLQYLLSLCSQSQDSVHSDDGGVDGNFKLPLQ